MHPAIRVDRLSKRYQLGTQRLASYQTLRESLTGAAAGAWHRARRLLGPAPLASCAASAESTPSLWAVKDISFEVQPGEVLGIIGANGAGKSTLMKILSRITEPTSGSVEIRGSLGSLLEVGTGFHPELSGLENIYLNGAILGMRRQEITRKLDQIIAFAQMEQFLHTPVKHYSSGMYVRLAFAVAAHLEPDILLVDEVLAVGDASFQKRCMGRMQEIGRGGRTILFISHNMAAVQALCARCLVLEKGRVVYAGATAEAVRRYFDGSARLAASASLLERTDRDGSGHLRFTAVEVSNEARDGQPITMLDDIVVKFHFKTTRPITHCSVGFHVNNAIGQTIYRVITMDTHGALPDLRGDGTIICRLKRPRLLPGKYWLTIVAATHNHTNPLDRIESAASFDVELADVYGTGHVPNRGVAYADCDWQLETTGSSSGA